MSVIRHLAAGLACVRQRRTLTPSIHQRNRPSPFIGTHFHRQQICVLRNVELTSAFNQSLSHIIMTITKSLILLIATSTANTILAFAPEIHRCSRGALFAKPKGTSTTKNNDDLPANLKRPVQAKRPLLGHVVPKDSRFKGCKLQTRQHKDRESV